MFRAYLLIFIYLTFSNSVVAKTCVESIEALIQNLTVIKSIPNTHTSEFISATANTGKTPRDQLISFIMAVLRQTSFSIADFQHTVKALPRGENFGFILKEVTPNNATVYQKIGLEFVNEIQTRTGTRFNLEWVPVDVLVLYNVLKGISKIVDINIFINSYVELQKILENQHDWSEKSIQYRSALQETFRQIFVEKSVRSGLLEGKILAFFASTHRPSIVDRAFVNPDLLKLIRSTEDPKKMLKAVLEVISAAREISDHDLYIVLNLIPRSISWGYDLNLAKEKVDEFDGVIARRTGKKWRSNFVSLDAYILMFALEKLTTIHSADSFGFAQNEIYQILGNSVHWQNKLHEYRICLVEYVQSVLIEKSKGSVTFRKDDKFLKDTVAALDSWNQNQSNHSAIDHINDYLNSIEPPASNRRIVLGSDSSSPRRDDDLLDIANPLSPLSPINPMNLYNLFQND